MRSSGGDRVPVITSVCSKRACGNRANVFSTQSEVLSAETKNFIHSAHSTSKLIPLKNKEIVIGR